MGTKRIITDKPARGKELPAVYICPQRSLARTDCAIWIYCIGCISSISPPRTSSADGPL